MVDVSPGDRVSRQPPLEQRVEVRVEWYPCAASSHRIWRIYLDGKRIAERISFTSHADGISIAQAHLNPAPSVVPEIPYNPRNARKNATPWRINPTDDI